MNDFTMPVMSFFPLALSHSLAHQSSLHYVINLIFYRVLKSFFGASTIRSVFHSTSLSLSPSIRSILKCHEIAARRATQWLCARVCLCEFSTACTSPSNDHLLQHLLAINHLESAFMDPNSQQQRIEQTQMHIQREREKNTSCEWCQCTTNGQRVLTMSTFYTISAHMHDDDGHERDLRLFSVRNHWIGVHNFFSLHSIVGVRMALCAEHHLVLYMKMK